MKRLAIAIAAIFVVAGVAGLGDAAYARNNDRGGPPGLANKPGGLPPGQAKKMWRKGEHIPAIYIAPQYYVEARVYHLAPPPPGYRWVVVDGDAYLVQTASGVIANVIADVIANALR